MTLIEFDRASAVAEINKLLSAENFVNRGFRWIKSDGEFFSVLELQTGAGRSDITVNIGQLDVAAYMVIWGRRPSNFPEPPECTLSLRIGQIMSGKDVWWPKSQESVPEIMEAIKAFAIPFLTSARTREGLLEKMLQAPKPTCLLPSFRINLCALEYIMGKKEDACRRVSEMKLSTKGRWTVKAEELELKFSCSS